VASPNGSDSAAGSEAAPFRTPQRLADSLGPGLTGCLREGLYEQDVKVTRGGSPAAPAVLQSYPGEQAGLVGRLWIAEGADNVTFAGIVLDGRNSDRLPSPTVNANGVVFEGNDVTNGNSTICFNLGGRRYGRAGSALLIDGAKIRGNRIHHCGELPPTNHHHGIYVVHATGTEITENVIYDNADRGIQLYPDAQRTLIRRNIVDGNGEGLIFSGADGVASNDTLVEGNVISNSRVRYNVESYYGPGEPHGERNVVTRNCLFGSSRNSGGGGVQENQDGFVAFANVVADPAFADRAAGDFRLAADSGCRSVFSDIDAAAPPPPRPAPADARDRTPPELGLRARRQRPRGVARRGLRVLLSCSEPCRAQVEARVSRRAARRLGLRGRVLGRAQVETARSGTQAVVIRPPRRARRALARVRALRIGLSATGADAAGNAARPARARAVLRR
jgi:parallel beta-helix repeat protein